jgi:hypothetical protein
MLDELLSALGPACDERGNADGQAACAPRPAESGKGFPSPSIGEGTDAPDGFGWNHGTVVSRR